jgi:hypothetical protein
MEPAFTFTKAAAGQGAMGPSSGAALRGKKGNRTGKNRPRIDYFRGPRCNKDWQQLESAEASRLRGHGFFSCAPAKPAGCSECKSHTNVN